MDRSPFEKALELAPDAEGRLRGVIPEGWLVVVGVHGGLISALLTRAASLAAGPERSLRSITIHFVRPARPGGVTISTEVVREGTGLTSLSLRLEQAHGTVALALAAAGVDRESDSHERLAMPDVAPPDQLEPLPYLDGAMPQFMAHADFRPVGGGGPGNPSESGNAEVLVWMQPIGGAPLDHAAIAFLADAAWPTVFALKGEVSGAPTIDLTIHFRDSLLESPDGDWVLGRFESHLVRDGHFEEDGVLWSRDGRVLAQTRQLALLLPLPESANIRPAAP